MGRKPRQLPESGIHHVMNRGAARQPVFFGDRDRIEFGRLLAELHERFGVETLAYCLMGNHYHLLLRSPDGRLPDAMQHLAGVFTRRVNLRAGRDGPLFRGRYHAIPVTSDEYLVWVTRYIHRNPLDPPGIRRPADYRWSSYRSYLGLRRTPPFLSTGLVLGMFDQDRRKLADFTDDADHSLPLSADSSVEFVRELVALAIAADSLAAAIDADPPQWIERVVLTLLSDGALPPAVSARVTDWLAAPTPTARRMAVLRARRRAATDDGVRRILATLTPDGHLAA
jgi:REP element-mobilizing transposase RayT